jgi:hypothetical protein
MKNIQQLVLAFLATSLPMLASAHMEMTDPPPLRSKHNPNTGFDGVDYSMTSPLATDGSNFPCKGFLTLLGTPKGKPVATWTAGQSYSFTIAGGAHHNGGSCQASLSTDGGKTFRVIHSYEGGCPGQGVSSFRFRVPGDTPATEGAVFAWTWFNNLGNREMYMNCAVVNIVGGGAGFGAEKVAFGGRPGLFMANIGNNCKTVETYNVKFPDPGPDMDSIGNVHPPEGSCGAGLSSGSGSGSGAGTGTGSGSGTGTRSGDSAGIGAPGQTQTSVPGEGTGSSGSTEGETLVSHAPAASTYSHNCQKTIPPPTAQTNTNGEGAGRGPGEWTPGNDWPDWFQSAGSMTFLPAYLVLAVYFGAVAISFLISG